VRHEHPPEPMHHGHHPRGRRRELLDASSTTPPLNQFLSHSVDPLALLHGWSVALRAKQGKGLEGGRALTLLGGSDGEGGVWRVDGGITIVIRRGGGRGWPRRART
jgi:hypothetical protein